MKAIVFLLVFLGCSCPEFVNYPIAKNDPDQYIIRMSDTTIYRRSYKYHFADSVWQLLSEKDKEFLIKQSEQLKK